MTEQLCDCGQPLHYTDPTVEASVTELVRRYGPTVDVKVGDAGKAAVKVPRHYIALHGLKADDVAELARRYNWKAAQ